MERPRWRPGEYGSVSSQRDAERADSSRELAADPESELAQLTEMYVRRGLDRDLAATVAERLLAVDPLDSHVRDQLGVGPGARIGRVGSQLGQAARLLGAGRAALRVTIGGGLAMGLTALIGQLVGTTGL